MDYIEKRTAGIFDDADESIKEAANEHGTIQITTSSTDNSKEVDAGDTSQDLTDIGLVNDSDPTREKPEASPDTSYTREMSFKLTSGEVELETPEKFKQAEKAKERLSEIRSVNEELKAEGSTRRYVPSKSDVPETAVARSDDFGTYYYKKLDVELRPSQVAEFNDVKAIVAFDESERVIKTVELLSVVASEPLLDAHSFKAAENWLSHHLVLTDDDPGSHDAFTHEFKDALAEAISGDSREDVGKRRVYIDDPSEAPEDVNVQEGDAGGLYYETGNGGGDVGEASLDDVEDALDVGFPEDPSDEVMDDAASEAAENLSEVGDLSDVDDELLADAAAEMAERDGLEPDEAREFGEAVISMISRE